jgi:diguanylate cyclase (GGDEF)-like protein
MIKYISYLLILFPTFTEYIESGHFPDTGRDFVTDVVMTIVTAIIVIMLNSRIKFIENLSLRDSLTGINNRRKFDLDIQQEVSRSKRTKTGVGLIFFDLDGFKEINDKYGHQEGDKVLIRFAKNLYNFSRKGTDYCYRFGGDEFAVLLTNINNDEFINISNKIEDRLGSIVYSKLSNSVSTSKGVVFLNIDETHQQFLKRADDAMYKAKRARYSGAEKL